MTDVLSYLPVLAPLLSIAALCVSGLYPSGGSGKTGTAGGGAWMRWVAMFGPLVAMWAATQAAYAFDHGHAGYQFETQLTWLPQLGINFRLGYDATSLPLVWMAGFVGCCAVLVADPQDARSREHWVLLLLTITAGTGAFLSINLFVFYFFCELATLPKYLLIARWGRQDLAGDQPLSRIALQVTLYIIFGAMAVLGVLVTLRYVTGASLDFDTLAKANIPAELQKKLYGAALLGLGCWSALWPLHGWAASTYAAAKAPTNMLFGAVAKAFGTYGLLRLGATALPLGAAQLSNVLLSLGVVGLLWAAWAALKQTDWNRMLAFASVSHAGYTFVALSVNTPGARTSAVVLMVAHALVTSLGFVLTDELVWTAGHRKLDKSHGLAKHAPWLGVAFMAFAVGATGLPSSGAFAAELMAFFSAWNSGATASRIGALVAIFGVVLSAAYVLRAIHLTFFGESGAAQGKSVQGRRQLPTIAVWALVAASTGLGVWPTSITGRFLPEKSEEEAKLTVPCSEGAVGPSCQPTPVELAQHEGQAPGAER